MPTRDEVTIEEARIIFRNFSGKAETFNKEGDRNFAILLEQETAALLIEAGWNVKHTKPRDDEEFGNPYIQVAVNYRNKPPRIVLLSKKRDGNLARTAIDEDLVSTLDYADIEVADVTITPYDWAVNGNTGRKAYLKVMFATIRVDPLDLKYEGIGEEDLDSGVAE